MIWSFVTFTRTMTMEIRLVLWICKKKKTNLVAYSWVNTYKMNHHIFIQWILLIISVTFMIPDIVSCKYNSIQKLMARLLVACFSDDKNINKSITFSHSVAVCSHCVHGKPWVNTRQNSSVVFHVFLRWVHINEALMKHASKTEI